MDFALTEEQEAFSELARQLLADGCTKERLIEIGFEDVRRRRDEIDAFFSNPTRGTP